MMLRRVVSFLVVGFMLLTGNNGFAYTHMILPPITWPGEKWEYLVEHPVNIHHVDVIEFEEICDEAGMHGWKLMEATDSFHFYTFYFTRPLLPHKIDAHTARLTRLKGMHEDIEAGRRHQIKVKTADRVSELKQKEAEENAIKEMQNRGITPSNAQLEVKNNVSTDDVKITDNTAVVNPVVANNALTTNNTINITGQSNEKSGESNPLTTVSNTLNSNSSTAKEIGQGSTNLSTVSHAKENGIQNSK